MSDQTQDPVPTPTVEQVLHLIPHVSLDTNATAEGGGVSAFAGAGHTKPILVTESMIQEFIEQAKNYVFTKTSKIITLSPTRTEISIYRSVAGNVIADGAAAITVGAVFPTMAAPNENTSYYQVLWDRFRTGAEDLAKLVDQWTDPANPENPDGAGGALPSYRFPSPPRFIDGPQW